MVITSYSNIVIYIGIFLVLPTFRNEMLLLGDAGVYYTLLAMGSELCNWLAASNPPSLPPSLPPYKRRKK